MILATCWRKMRCRKWRECNGNWHRRANLRHAFGGGGLRAATWQTNHQGTLATLTYSQLTSIRCGKKQAGGTTYSIAAREMSPGPLPGNELRRPSSNGCAGPYTLRLRAAVLPRGRRPRSNGCAGPYTLRPTTAHHFCREQLLNQWLRRAKHTATRQGHVAGLGQLDEPMAAQGHTYCDAGSRPIICSASVNQWLRRALFAATRPRAARKS